MTHSRWSKRIANKIITAIALSSIASCAVLSLGCKGQSFNIGPSTGEVVGAVVGVVAVVGGTTAILIAVHHSHHTVKGCVSSGSNGLEVVTDDKKTYLLTGNTPGVPVGNLVKFHGTKIKRPKHSSGEQTFAVEKIGKNYGPCKVIPITTASTNLNTMPKAE